MWNTRTIASIFTGRAGLLVLVLLCGCDSTPTIDTVNRTADPTKLAAIAIEADDPEVRLAAVRKINDQAVLARVAMETQHPFVRDADLTFDCQKVKTFEASDRDVRLAAVSKLTDQDVLSSVAIKATDQNVRRVAYDRLSDEQTKAKTRIWLRPHLAREVIDQALLAKLATEAVDRDVRQAAAEKLTDGAPLEALEQLAQRSTSREVLRIVLAKVDDIAVLSRIADAAVSPAMRLAAARKAGKRTWSQIFKDASAPDAPDQLIGDAMVAVLLFERWHGNPAARPAYAQEHVPMAMAVSELIKRTLDRKRPFTPELLELLEYYGTDTYNGKMLAETYLGSGCVLKVAAEEWALRHGYKKVFRRRH